VVDDPGALWGFEKERIRGPLRRLESLTSQILRRLQGTEVGTTSWKAQVLDLIERLRNEVELSGVAVGGDILDPFEQSRNLLAAARRALAEAIPDLIQAVSGAVSEADAISRGRERLLFAAALLTNGLAAMPDPASQTEPASGGEPGADKWDYDVALSFAGEDRSYAEELAECLKGDGVRVFYDRYEAATLWGKDLYEHLAWVYGKAARFCVMFVSQHYAAKVWTTHERRNAQARALSERQEYILPVRLDDTELPGLAETIVYEDLRQRTLAELCQMVLVKLGQTVATPPGGHLPVPPTLELEFDPSTVAIPPNLVELKKTTISMRLTNNTGEAQRWYQVELRVPFPVLPESLAPIGPIRPTGPVRIVAGTVESNWRIALDEERGEWLLTFMSNGSVAVYPGPSLILAQLDLPIGDIPSQIGTHDLNYVISIERGGPIRGTLQLTVEQAGRG